MYMRRYVDAELDQIMPDLAAIAIEGARGTGKTETATQRAKSIFNLDDPKLRSVIEADNNIIMHATKPVLIDEWQHLPHLWDKVRRAVDQKVEPGSFLLAGSATPRKEPKHSGAGRIVTLRMRPFAFAERQITTPTVLIDQLLEGNNQEITGECDLTLSNYVDEILCSGFPGIRDLGERARRLQLSSYIERLINKDMDDQSTRRVRRPDSLLAWLRAYAAATASTASWEVIRKAATPGDGDPPAKTTTIQYRDWLTSLWLLDSVPAWNPHFATLKSLAKAPKHHLVDPALAAILLQATKEKLLNGEGHIISSQASTLLGALFESLVTLSVRAAAQAAQAEVFHLRNYQGTREIDLIVERYDGQVLPIEVKMKNTVSDKDVRHLLWLKETLPDKVADTLIVYTGSYAYRRKDGVAVVPLGLLG